MSKDLAMQYVMPTDTEYTVKSSDNEIHVELNPFEEITITGFVKDKAKGTAINYASVSITQTLNGKYSKSVVVTTDYTGKFTANVFKTACKVVVSANDYMSNTISIDDIENTESLNNILLKELTGVKINTLFTYTNSVVDGETAEIQNYYSDYANVSYTVFNKTTQCELPDFNIQYPYIVMIGNINIGDVLSVTATSRNNMFEDVTAEGTVDKDNMVIITFPIVEHGKLQSTYNESEVSKVVGVLYDSKKQFIRKSNYSNNTIVFDNLVDGDYSLVTMKNCELFNSILNLNDLNAIGLEEGVHYTKNDVIVESGKITEVVIDEIYNFDESEFYYTGNNTQFTVNKPSVTVGNYVTLRAKVDFKPEFASGITDVKLIFNLPNTCEFVNNSVMIGNGLGSYTIGKNRVEVEMTNINELVRFCIIPMESGTCTPNAMVQFTYNGEVVLQPIGSAMFEVELMKIIVPEITADTMVAIRGYAPASSNIVIYDNGVIVGSTQATLNGIWQTKIELHKPYSYSYHSIYAEIINRLGQKFLTDTKDLLYDVNYTSLTKIRMLYNNKEIVFDVKEGTVEPANYTYVGQLGISDYTFIAEFANDDPSSLTNVMFVVLLTDGTAKYIGATYDSSKKYWIASADFPNDTQVPINVRLEYDYVSYTDFYDDERAYDDSVYYHNELKYVKELFDNGLECIIIDNENELLMSIVPEGNDKEEYFKINKMDYNTMRSSLIGTFTHIVNDTLDYYYKDTLTDSSFSILVLDNINKEAFVYEYYGTNIQSDEQDRILPAVISASASVIMAGFERFVKQSSLEQWRKYYMSDIAMLEKNIKSLRKMLYAKCDDGTYKIDNPDMFESQIVDLEKNIDIFAQEYENFIDLMERSYNNTFMRQSILGVALSSAGFAVSKLITNSFTGVIFKSTFDNASLITTASLETIAQMLGLSINDLLSSSIEDEILEWNRNKMSGLTNDISGIASSIKSNWKCEKEEVPIEEDDCYYPTPPLKPVIDPSGYVYEGVSSNRVEGVMASCYYKEFVEDMYGDIIEKVVLWDAEAYAQENPLFTDENGMYRWDVPQGLWQVKFEKEGYQTTYSDWLPVPPPQLEVNIPITQYVQPNVISAVAYQDAIEVQFDKYMLPAYLTTDNIVVTSGGNVISGTIELLDEEESYEGFATSYASKVRFNAVEQFPDDEVTILVKNNVKSYAHIRMQDDFMQTFTVELEMQKIVCPSNVYVNYNEEKTIEVSVIPAAASKGKTLNVKSMSPLILSVNVNSVVLDEEGKTQIKLKGELPGTASLSFNIEGYDINAQSSVKVEKKIEYDSKQTTTLNEGWNWFSTYLEIDGENGLRRIQDALGSNAEQIKNQFAFSSYNSAGWFGLLNDASTESMYMIKMSEDAEVSIDGNVADPSEHPITLEQNWTWFGYILNEDMSLENGLVNFTPNNGDYIKSQQGFNTYYNGSWYGETILSFETGKGYMYNNTSNSAKTFVYPTNTSKGRFAETKSVDKHWIVDVNKYPTNMSVIAIVNMEGKEMSEYEIGAFSNGECRGSARPVYIDALDRYLLFLTIHGEGDEEITFKYYDIRTDEEYEFEADEIINYFVNGILGSMTEPYVLNFAAMNVDEYLQYSFEVYPNPVNRNSEIYLGTICDRVEVYNSVGIKIADYQNVGIVEGVDVPGVYIINAINNNSVKYCRVIVK